MASATTTSRARVTKPAKTVPAPDKPVDGIDLTLFTWHVAFQPGSKPRFADDAYFDNPGTPLSERELREGLRKRWGHAGRAGHIPTARRPYARRSTRGVVEETLDYAPEVLQMLDVQQVRFPLPGR